MKTSARMFLIFALFGVVSGVLYAISTKEYAGLLMFFLFGVANLFLAVLMLVAGDTEVAKSKARQRGPEEHHEVHLPPPSILPFVIAVGMAVFGWGTLLKPPVVVVGILIIFVGTVGWAGGFGSINRDLAAWGEVWRYRQYKNLDDIEKEFAAQEERDRRP